MLAEVAPGAYWENANDVQDIMDHPTSERQKKKTTIKIVCRIMSRSDIIVHKYL